MMSDEILLSVDDSVEGRPFTNRDNSQEDLATMRKMARQLTEAYSDPVICDFTPGKRPVCQSDPSGRHFRIYYIQPSLLFTLKSLTVVGFFGQKRPNADVRPLLKADARFEKEFYRHEGLLSLSTVRLANGDFGNLVLFTSPEAKDQWNFSEPHYDTVSRISPPYYKSIRLNNGFLPSGLASPDALELQKVKYLDYDSIPPWRAIRKFV